MGREAGILTPEQVAVIRSHYCLNDQAAVSLRALCDSHEAIRYQLAVAAERISLQSEILSRRAEK